MTTPVQFCRSHLQVSVAQICQNLGWNSAHTSPLELLTDVLERYMLELGKVSHRYSEQFGRTEPNLDDLALTFRHMGISLNELEDYVRHVEPVPFAQEVVAFPASKTNSLQFPKPSSREILHHREEHIHEHLPHMFPGMEDEVVGDSATAVALTSQPTAQSTAPPDVSTPVAAGEKRPAQAPTEMPTPVKRPRVIASNLPEEAGHSQYEMSSVIMSPDGFLTPIRGKGRLPDACTPPPTIRHTLTYTSTTSGASKAVDGSEANKENAAVEAPAKEPSAASVPTGKEGASAASAASSTKPESAKSKGKKKDKLLVKEKVKKQKSDSQASKTSIKVVVRDGDAVRVKPSKPKPAKKTKEKVEKKAPKPKEGKPAKIKKTKAKGEAKKGLTVSPSPSVSNVSVKDSSSDSRLKDLLLAQDKFSVRDVSDKAPSTTSKSVQDDYTSLASPNSDLLLRQAFPPTDIFEGDSHETSPQRLVIAEAEGRAQEREEEKRIRLKNIDDTISSVIKQSTESVTGVKEKGRRTTSPAKSVLSSKSNESPSPKKRGRPKKVKPKDKIKSSEFIAEDVIKREKEDEVGARNSESIMDTINAVIAQGTLDAQPPPPSASPEKSADTSIPSTPTPAKRAKKEGKAKALDKDKSPGVKKKLKAKLQGKDKDDGAASSAPPPVEVKPFVSDKFSNAEMKVFEFGESDSPPALPERRPSQAEKEPSPPPPAPPPATPPPVADSFSPVERKPVIKSPTPETAVAASSASASSATNVDPPSVQPLKIGIPKDKEKDKHREKSKSKEHRKDKKEKRRDKEKKKKNKDKDRERDRHEKVHHEHKHEKNKIKEETPPAEGAGLKIKIKLGSVPNSSPSMVMAESKGAAEASIKQEAMSPSHRPELKLVIRRDMTEGGSSQKKHSSSVPKSAAPVVKSEPRNTPPTLHPASPLPGTPPPPVLSRNNSPVRDPSPSAPRHKGKERSPVCKSPLEETFTFTSPQSSPPRGRPSVSPVPPTPAAVPPKSPSPVPKTPSPRQHGFSGSPMSVSSPPRGSPSAGHKSPTPTPRTPSLSPAYPPTSPFQPDHSPVRREKSPAPIKPLFGTPERESSLPSPLFADAPAEMEEPEVKPQPPPPTVSKPRGKVGRPRSKSPRATSPKGKSPKGAGKAAKSPKVAVSGKSPGRGRPPKAKTLAMRAAQAAAVTKEDAPPVKPKVKPPPPVAEEAPEVDKADEEAPPLSSSSVKEEKASPGSSPDSPSSTSLVIATGTTTTRQRGTVEAETVGFFIDPATGQQIWICPSCKMQDDGSPMIGCDKCDDWYHWVCVNITKEPPAEQSWFCPRCSAKAKQVKPRGKRGRKKKLH